MSNRKVEPIISPSSVCKEDLKDVQVKGNACLNSYALNRMIEFYKEPSLETDNSLAELELTECAAALMTLVKNHTSHNVGPFTLESKPNGKTVSGIFAAHLQHLLSRFMFPEQPRVPDVIVATGQKLKSGSIDATIYKNLGATGLHPRVLFEFAVDDVNREPQLFSYVNNASTVLGGDIQLLMTGCVVVMSRDRPTANRLQVFTYVKIRPPAAQDNGQGGVIATIPIFDGTWSAATVKRLLRLVRDVVSLPRSHFDMPAGDLMPYERIRENVLIDGNVVYKIYDYRNHAGVGDRRPGGSITFLGGEEVLRDDTGLSVIKYPYLEGDHTALLAVDFVGVLLHLRDVHAAGQLHMDIKAGNVIFNHSDGAASRLIDFDYCGRVGHVVYPARYNQNIADGARHRDAVAGNNGTKAHDFFAMMSVMQLFRPSNSALAHLWNDWSTRVGEGQLEAVASELAERGGAFALALEAGLVIEGPTGSPKGGYKRKHGGAAEEEAEAMW
jgi:hypothetical protein